MIDNVNNKGKIMLNRLKMLLSKITWNYTKTYLGAGIRQSYVGGIRVDSKRDVRKAYLMDVKMLIETARFHDINAKELIKDKSLLDELDAIDDKSNNPLDEVNLD